MFNILLITGPNGSGKTSLTQALAKSGKREIIVRHTTRTRDFSEKNGVQYHFITRKVFEKMIKSDFFVEYELFPQGYYGTSKKAIVDSVSRSRCVMEINPSQLARTQKFCIAQFITVTTALVIPCTISLFKSKPNLYLEILRKRMIERGRHSDLNEAELKSRLKAANGIKNILPLCDIIIENEHGFFERSLNQLS